MHSRPLHYLFIERKNESRMSVLENSLEMGSRGEGMVTNQNVVLIL